MTSQPLTITVQEARTVLGVSRDWIEDRIKDGTLSSTKVARTRFLSRAEVMALVPGKAKQEEAA